MEQQQAVDEFVAFMRTQPSKTWTTGKVMHQPENAHCAWTWVSSNRLDLALDVSNGFPGVSVMSEIWRINDDCVSMKQAHDAVEAYLRGLIKQ